VNAFTLHAVGTDLGSHLVLPSPVDASEFLKKGGGGSVKCMIGILGPVIAEPGFEPNVQRSRVHCANHVGDR